MRRDGRLIKLRGAMIMGQFPLRSTLLTEGYGTDVRDQKSVGGANTPIINWPTRRSWNGSMITDKQLTVGKGRSTEFEGG